jgi:hypothetical protein
MCEDDGAMEAWGILDTINNVEDALLNVALLPIHYVGFLLSRWFRVPVSGGRTRLRELIVARFHTATATTATAIATATVAEDGIGARSNPREYTRLSNEIAGVILDDIELVLKPSHPRFDDDISGDDEWRSLTITSIGRVVQLMIEAVDSHVRNVTTNQADMDAIVYSKLMSLEWILSMMSVPMDAAHVCFSQPFALEYIAKLIKIHHLMRLIDGRTARWVGVSRVPDVMKVLKIKVVFKPEAQDGTTQGQQDGTTQGQQDGRQQGQQDGPPTCSICFDDLDVADVVMTQCGHTFCAGCVGGHAAQRGIRSFIRCPCCRADIVELAVSCPWTRDEVKAGLEPVNINL